MQHSIGVSLCVYNGEKFLGQMLASIHAQSRRPDAVVIVDDGSTDATLAVASTWERLLPVQIVSHPENRGLASSRNTAAAALTTDLIINADADDYWFPDHLEEMERVYSSNGGLISGNALTWFPGSSVSKLTSSERFPIPGTRQLEHLLADNFVFGAAMFERRLFHEVGGCRDIRSSEDWDLWIRMASAGAKISAPSHPTCLYRQHDQSLSADANTLPFEIEVLEHFISVSRNPALCHIAAKSLKRRRARLALRVALGQARQGRNFAARRSALKGLRGSPPVIAKSAAMILSPGLTLRTYEGGK